VPKEKERRRRERQKRRRETGTKREGEENREYPELGHLAAGSGRGKAIEQCEREGWNGSMERRRTREKEGGRGGREAEGGIE
jgi:hypothetical protein